MLHLDLFRSKVIIIILRMHLKVGMLFKKGFYFIVLFYRSKLSKFHSFFIEFTAAKMSLSTTAKCTLQECQLSIRFRNVDQ